MNKRASSTGDGDRRVDFLARPSPVGAVTAPYRCRFDKRARNAERSPSRRRGGMNLAAISHGDGSLVVRTNFA